MSLPLLALVAAASFSAAPAAPARRVAVLDLADLDLHACGRNRTDLDVDFLLGVGKAGQRVVFLLDIARLLSARDRADLESATV